jgi:hypothetical protein
MHEAVLMEKTKPAWQKGKLNGVSGKAEPGELYQMSMAREAIEKWQKTNS